MYIWWRPALLRGRCLKISAAGPWASRTATTLARPLGIRDAPHVHLVAHREGGRGLISGVYAGRAMGIWWRLGLRPEVVGRSAGDDWLRIPPAVGDAPPPSLRSGDSARAPGRRRVLASASNSQVSRGFVQIGRTASKATIQAHRYHPEGPPAEPTNVGPLVVTRSR